MFEQFGPELADFIQTYPTLSVTIAFLMLIWKSLDYIEKGFGHFVTFTHQMRRHWKRLCSVWSRQARTGRRDVTCACPQHRAGEQRAQARS